MEASPLLHFFRERASRDDRHPFASRAVGGRATTHLAVLRGTKWMGGGMIHVVQDSRGRYRSEGDYAMYRVPRGAFNSKRLALMDEVSETNKSIVITLLKETTGKARNRVFLYQPDLDIFGELPPS